MSNSNKLNTDEPGNIFCVQRAALYRLEHLRNTKQLLKDMFRHNSCHLQFIAIELNDLLYIAKLQVVKDVSCFLNVYLNRLSWWKKWNKELKKSFTYGSLSRSLSLGRPMYSASSWNKILMKTRLKIVGNKKTGMSGEISSITETD